RERCIDATHACGLDCHTRPCRGAGRVSRGEVLCRVPKIARAVERGRQTARHELRPDPMNTAKVQSKGRRAACDGFIVVAVLWMLGALAVLASIYSAYVINTAAGFGP